MSAGGFNENNMQISEASTVRRWGCYVPIYFAMFQYFRQLSLMRDKKQRGDISHTSELQMHAAPLLIFIQAGIQKNAIPRSLHQIFVSFWLQCRGSKSFGSALIKKHTQRFKSLPQRLLLSSLSSSLLHQLYLSITCNQYTDYTSQVRRVKASGSNSLVCDYLT